MNQKDNGRRPLHWRIKVRLGFDAPVVLKVDLGGGQYDVIGL